MNPETNNTHALNIKVVIIFIYLEYVIYTWPVSDYYCNALSEARDVSIKYVLRQYVPVRLAHLYYYKAS